MTERLRVGVVGSGIGRAHVEAYRSLPELFEVAAICDVEPERARQVAIANEIPRVVTEFTALCALDDLDVIDICTPP
jgi:predicted dehydrogenase